MWILGPGTSNINLKSAPQSPRLPPDFYASPAELRFWQDFDNGSHRFLRVENSMNKLDLDPRNIKPPFKHNPVEKIPPPLQFIDLTFTRPRFF